MNFSDDIKIPRTQLGIINNPGQGKFKRVLCVCTVGVLRSPTIAEILSRDPFNFNCRAVGWDSEALIPVSGLLVEWADVIVCADSDTEFFIKDKFKDRLNFVDIINFNIPDNFDFREQKLIDLITDKANLFF